jgi:hypothetical protein
VNALLYLTWTSGRNRFWTSVRRVRSPRYAAALLVGGLYIWAFLFRPMRNTGLASLFLGQGTEMVITLLSVLTLMGSWVFGADATALAFTQAEVSILFSAPLSRRRLIGYKLFRAQIAVLINSLIWVFVLRRGGTILPSPLRAISLWVLFSTLNLHRLGAALVRSSWREHGGIGAKRHRWSIIVFALIAVMLIAGLYSGRRALIDASDAGEFFNGLGRTLASAPAIWGLYPFHLVVAPTFARSIAEWGRLIVPAVAMLAGHAWWVLRTDAAFEEAALEASIERARRVEAMRARRSLGAVAPPRVATSTLRLASAGHPAFAIIWKNMLCLRRTIQLHVFIGPLVMSIALGTAFSTGAGWPMHLALTALNFAGLMLVLGGRLIRNDLRQDMQHLPLIKSLPMSPHDIVLAEVASSALPMAAVQVALVLIAFFALIPTQLRFFSPDIRLALLAASPFLIVALNGALITVQNAMAVLFPAWVRLGPIVTTGVEALGQNVLAMLANLVFLGLGLVIPVVVAFGSVRALHQTRPVAIALIVIVSSLILSLETYGAMRFLGRGLARAEPMQTA